jgi:hypothetical protein
MDCKEFKTYWNKGNIHELDEALQDEVNEHYHSCISCSDQELRCQLESRGVKVNEYPCIHMANYAEFHCEQHPNPHDCNDVIIHYIEKFDEYVIPSPYDDSLTLIRYCPWCGIALPESKRYLWFSTLERLGYDDPLCQEIPEEYKSKQWWQNRQDTD